MDSSLIVLDRESLVFRPLVPSEDESRIAENHFTVSLHPNSPPKIIFKIETTFEGCTIQPPLGILVQEIPSRKILVSLRGTTSERTQIEVIAAPVPSEIVEPSDLDELWSSVVAKAGDLPFKIVLPCIVKEWRDEELRKEGEQETREYTLKEELNDEEQEERVPGEGGILKEEFLDEKAGLQEISGEDRMEKELKQEAGEKEDSEKDTSKKEGEKFGEEELLNERPEEQRENELEEELQQEETGVEYISTNVLDTKEGKLTDEEDNISHEIMNKTKNNETGGKILRALNQVAPIINELVREVVELKMKNDLLEKEINEPLKMLEKEAEKEAVLLHVKNMNKELKQEIVGLKREKNLEEEVNFPVKSGQERDVEEGGTIHDYFKSKGLENKVETLQRENKELRDEIDALLKNKQDEAAKEENKVILLETKNKELEYEIEELKKENEDLEDELDLLLTMEQDKSVEEAVPIQSDTKNKELEYKVVELKRENTELKDKVDVLLNKTQEQLTVELERKNEKLKKDVSVLVKFEQNRHAGYNDVRNRGSKYEVEERKMENEDLKSEVNEVLKQKQKIKAKEESSWNQAADRNIDLEYEIEELKKEYIQLHEDIDNLFRMQHEKEIMLSQANAFTKEYSYAIEGLKRENNYLKAEVDALLGGRSGRVEETEENMSNQAQATKKEMEYVVEKLRIENADLKE